jgi:MFS family permease
MRGCADHRPTVPDRLAPLRIPAFRRFLAARLVDTLGNAIAPIAVAFAVLDLTGSAGDLGLILAARSIPLVLFLLFGGVFADRLPRHLVMVVANLAGFVTQAAAAVLLLTGTAQVWQLMVLEALNGAAVAFFLPAMTGVTPALVPAPLLQQANAMTGFARYGSQVVGAALGGILVAAVGSGWGVAIDAATFGASAALLAGLRLPAGVRAAGGNVLRELRDGWREFASRTWLWVVVAGFAVLNAIEVGAWNTLGPVIADHTFGRAAWGFVLAAEAAGTIVATLAMLRWRLSRPLLAGMLGMAGVLPSLVLLAVLPAAAPLAAAALVTGVGVGVFSIAWDTALGQHVPLDKLSRVSAYDVLGSLLAIPVGQLAAGRLATAVPPATLVLTGAALYAAVTLAILLSRDVRNLRSTDPAAPAAPPPVPASPGSPPVPSTGAGPAG